MPKAPRFDSLEYLEEDGTAWVTMNRPEQLNAMSPAMYSEIRSAFRYAEATASVDSVVLTGRGRAFAAGGDLKDVISRLDDEDPLKIFEYEDAFPFDTILRASKVYIAAINGTCVGGGLCLTALADFVVSVDTATFGIPEGRVGMASSSIPAFLFGRVPLGAITSMALTGSQIDAQEAYRIGLVNVITDAKNLRTQVIDLLQRIRRTTPESRAIYKRVLAGYRPRPNPKDMYDAWSQDSTRERLRSFGRQPT